MNLSRTIAFLTVSLMSFIMVSATVPMIASAQASFANEAPIILAQGDEDPNDSYASGGLVPCSGVGEDKCGYDDFILLINDLINWLIIVATGIATLLFVYAGVLYLTAGGSEGQVKKANSIFTKVAIGFLLILTAYLIVNAIVSVLVTDEFSGAYPF